MAIGQGFSLYEAKVTKDEEGRSVLHVVLDGAVANLNLDLDTSVPLPVQPPAADSNNLADSRGFLATLAGAIASAAMKVTPPTADSTNLSDARGFLSTLAGAVASGSMKAVLQAGSALIGKVDINPATPYIDTISGADTAPHQLPSQAVKGPVFLRAGADNTGNVTVTDGTRVAGVVLKKGEPLPVHVTNLSQITYTFAVGASTEKLLVSTGI